MPQPAEPGYEAYRPGDIVDVTFSQVRVRAVPTNRAMVITLDVAAQDYQITIPTSPDVKVRRSRPASWPPKPGDLWSVNGTSVFFYSQVGRDGAFCARTTNGQFTDDLQKPDRLIDLFNLFRGWELLYREEN